MVERHVKISNPAAVVIPIYGAAAELRTCLTSVFRHTELARHRLVLVVDGPQPAAVEQVLADLVADQDVVDVLRNPKRRGFVASVNRGMADCDGDVVLLNSDTEVTEGWLDRLVAAAYCRARVATATPFSNNATICSLPETLLPNHLPTGHDVDRLAAVVEHVSRREYPRLPTGVGVCLYIRRAALDELGAFDEPAFAHGYGEETDFCRRAHRAGWEHVLDDATFVFHVGRRSFGKEGRALEEAANRTIRRRYPDYFPELARFIGDDPLRAARQRIVDALAPAPFGARRTSVLHVVHGWPPFNHAGTEVYARWLATEQVDRHRVAVFTRVADDTRRTGDESALNDRGVRVRLVVNNFDRRNPLARNALVDLGLERSFAGFLDDVRPDLVHVHHLSGHCATLMRVAAERGVRIVYQVQDWWAACSRANLVRDDATPCPGPLPGRCGRCLPLTHLFPARLLNPLLYLLRARILARQLAKAHAYVMGSEAIHSWYREAGLLAPGVPAHVLPYGVPAAKIGGPEGSRTSTTGRPLRFGFIGSIMPHKGAHVAAQAFRGVRPQEAELEIWGDPTILPDYARSLLDIAEPGVVFLKGRFEEPDKVSILGHMDVLLVPSIGLESFGIVAREAMAAGVPVVASRIGALAEFEVDGCGATVPPGDADALADWVRRLVDNPEILEGWRQSLPAVLSVGDHARQIDTVYNQVLQQ